MNGSFRKTVEVKWLIVKVKANRLHTYRKSPAWKKCLVCCKLSTKNNHKWSQIRFTCLFPLTENGWDIISRDLTPSEKFQWISSILFDINRVFFTGPPLSLLCKKTNQTFFPRLAPLKIEKKNLSAQWFLEDLEGGQMRHLREGSLETF